MATVEAYSTKNGERRYRVRYRKPDRSQTDKRGFKTKKAADEYLARLHVDLVDGNWIDPSNSKKLLGPIAEDWYSSCLDLKPTTLAGYRQSLNKHILPTWGNRSVGSIGFAEVQAWVSKLASELSASSTRQILYNLRSILDFAIQDNKLKKNACDGVRQPKLIKTNRSYLNHDGVLKLAEASGDAFDIILTLAYTGIRIGELVGLRVNAIDFTDNHLNIVESISEVGGNLIEGTPKNGEQRRVPFPEFLVPFLHERIRGKSPTDRVFSSAKGGVLRVGNFRRDKFRPAVAAVQLIDPEFPTVTLHDLRHTAASLAISAGANVKSLQTMLGHARASMTLDVYADLFKEDLSAVSVALNDIAGPNIVGKMWAMDPESSFKTSG